MNFKHISVVQSILPEIGFKVYRKIDTNLILSKKELLIKRIIDDKLFGPKMWRVPPNKPLFKP